MRDFQHLCINANLAKVLQRLHYPLEVILVCARCYAAYLFSFRLLEEIVQERDVFVDHFRVPRCALKILPVKAHTFRRRKRSVARSCRMDEIYIKVAGQWTRKSPRYCGP